MKGQHKENKTNNLVYSQHDGYTVSSSSMMNNGVSVCHRHRTSFSVSVSSSVGCKGFVAVNHWAVMSRRYARISLVSSFQR